MEIVDFYTSGRQEHWLGEIKRSDWRAAAYLCDLLSKDTFYETFGDSSKLLLLTDGDELISFCTCAEKDEIQPTQLTPWIGFVYTFPKHRGHRYMGLLFDEAERLAKADNFRELYISTDQIGLYEKYGFEYITQMKSVFGDLERIYEKKIV